MIKYGVAKTSFDSSRLTWDQAKSCEYAYIITSGLGVGTFFTDKVFETKEEAKNYSYLVRDRAAYDRSRARYGYLKYKDRVWVPNSILVYKDRVWVHEYLYKGYGRPAYLPTVGEIKKGLAYIAENLKSENFQKEWVDWAVKHEGMSAAQVRKELIDNFLKDCTIFQILKDC